ncbi:thiamine-phosphate kinase [Actinotignum sanguinis]|uniref:thiamine-phosphate kinase n=1 Tax=Actinotignum sanguinis TaxID=1445614 RepID=UPI000F7D6864|nr:thiamine-phosphate kinase [Actinotignum sanguinis]MDY5147489.1 thiamine-phosphate kinase [Actinotignum sanguinis]RTE51610.1 thiamine-phosphate kinase [Actinotignum sanguinis]
MVGSHETRGPGAGADGTGGRFAGGTAGRVPGPLVRDLSEAELLARIVPLLPRGETTIVPSGDDSAVLGLSDGRVTVSTDMLVEGVHFRRDWFNGRDVGWRVAAQNIADAVAMGARPRSLVVAMELPGDVPVAWVADIARGLAEYCGPLGCGVDGGDLVSGSHIAISATILGDLEGRTPLRRSAAAPGQPLIHCGNLGRAAAGFELLNRGFAPDRGAFPDAATRLMQDFLRPRPPVPAVLSAVRAGLRGAMMDVSDGLIRDAQRIAAASGVHIDIHSETLSRHAQDLLEVARHLGRSDPLEWAYDCVLSGGEDHGFLATMDVSPERAWGARIPHLPEGFSLIGTVEAAHPAGLVTVDGRAWNRGNGWDHFRRSS